LTSAPFGRFPRNPATIAQKGEWQYSGSFRVGISPAFRAHRVLDNSASCA
jgi:hypothetical protein